MSSSRIVVSILALVLFVGSTNNTFAVAILSPTPGANLTKGSNINFQVRVPTGTSNGSLMSNTVVVTLRDSSFNVVSTPALTSYFESPTNSFIYQADPTTPSVYPSTTGSYYI